MIKCYTSDMKKLIFLHQECHHCYVLLSFIDINDLGCKLGENDTYLTFYDPGYGLHERIMKTSLDKLAEERDDPVLSSQNYATPMMVELDSEGGVTNIWLGLNSIIKYLSEK